MQKIAIVGMAARFAGAPDVAAVSTLLEGGNGLDGQGPAIRLFDPQALRLAGRMNLPTPGPDGLCAAGLLDAADAFDPVPFGLSARAAEGLTVRERLVLTAVWQAVEDAGVGLPALRQGRTAVYVGAMRPSPVEDAGGDGAVGRMLAGQGFMLANRVSAVLGLSGASETLDAAHASGLVALHRARQALLAGECDHAVVAAVTYDFAFWEKAPAGVLSPSGRCRVFDAGADGVAPTEGVGAILLTTAARAEALALTPHALMLGSAVGHAAGTAPLGQSSRTSQSAVLRDAWAAAGLRGRDLAYVEAHGTGTVAGDPVEVAALDDALAADGATEARCLVGSVKAVLGHAEASAGIAGLIKALWVLRHRRVPGQPGLERLNPLVSGARAVAVATEARDLPAEGPLRVGVTALGIGGTCAHVVLESAPASPPADTGTPERLPFLLSASDAATLDRLRERWRTAPPEAPLADVCATLALGRVALPARFGVLADSVEAALAAPLEPAAPWTPHGLLVSAPTVEAPDPVATAKVLLAAGAVQGPVTAVGEGIWPLLVVAGMADDEPQASPGAVPTALRRPCRPVLDPVSGAILGLWRFADLVDGLGAAPAAHLRERWRALRDDLDAAALLAPWTNALEHLGGAGVEPPEGAGREIGRGPLDLLWDMALADALSAHLTRWGLPLGGGADEGAFAALRFLLAEGADRLDLAAALAGDAAARSRLDGQLARLSLAPPDGALLDEIPDVAVWIDAVRAAAVPEGDWISTAADPLEVLLSAWRGGAAIDWAPVFSGVPARRCPLPLTPLRSAVAATVEVAPDSVAAGDDASLRAWLRRVVAEEAGIDPALISDDGGLNESCGVDSIANTAIVKRLSTDLGHALPSTLLFAHTTVAALARHLRQAVPDALAAVVGEGSLGDVDAPVGSVRSARPERRTDGAAREPVAIVGLAGRWPGAEDKEAFWDLLLDGIEAVREVPADRWDWTRWGGSVVTVPAATTPAMGPSSRMQIVSIRCSSISRQRRPGAWTRNSD